jgi:uncharacterized protein YkuJ
MKKNIKNPPNFTFKSGDILKCEVDVKNFKLRIVKENNNSNFQEFDLKSLPVFPAINCNANGSVSLLD